MTQYGLSLYPLVGASEVEPSTKLSPRSVGNLSRRNSHSCTEPGHMHRRHFPCPRAAALSLHTEKELSAICYLRGPVT